MVLCYKVETTTLEECYSSSYCSLQGGAKGRKEIQCQQASYNFESEMCVLLVTKEMKVSLEIPITIASKHVKCSEINLEKILPKPLDVTLTNETKT